MRIDGNRSQRRVAEVLVLNRKPGDSILIGDDVEVFISDLGERSVKVGIEAPKEVSIRRAEVSAARNSRDVKADGTRQARPKRQRGSRSATSPRPRRLQLSRSAEGRRRVIIDPALAPEPETAEIGQGMMRDAIKSIPHEVLEAVARGDAIDHRIRRALIELAREELIARERAEARA
jgi:carbon storage regulator